MRESQAVLQALLAASPELATLDQPMAVVQRCCEVVTEASPHVVLAWFWHGRRDAGEIRPLVSAGPATDRAASLAVPRTLWTRPGSAWRVDCRDAGLEVAVGFPVALPDPDEAGVMVFHADRRTYFDTVGAEPFAAFARFAEVALAQIEARRRLSLAASTDPLTGQRNRRAMGELLEQLHAQAGRARSRLSVVMLDIDHFKSINDRFGHEAGDQVLRAVAQCLRHQLRVEDHLARWGGEEFLAVLPGADAEDVSAITERLRSGVESLRVPIGDLDISVTCSVGVATCGPRMASLDRLIREADSALYRAKQGGRNRVCLNAPAVA